MHALLTGRPPRTVAATILLLAAGMTPMSVAEGQLAVRTNTVVANVSSIGTVLGKSALVAGNRENTGNLYVSGTVTTLHNGPYQLQVRLSAPFTDKNKANVVNTVKVRTPSGSYATVTTTGWVTATTGPGSPSSLNQVQFYIVWGKSSAKDPKHAITIPVIYQVVPL